MKNMKEITGENRDNLIRASTTVAQAANIADRVEAISHQHL
jgi:hypothetical protein